jgi:replicative DNA helicase
VLFFSLEMSARELICRILSSETGIPNNYILRNPKKLSAEQKQLLAKQTDVTKLPMNIFDEGKVTMSSIRANCRKAKDTVGCDFIIVDYLQIMSPENEAQRKDTNKFYEEVTRDLKILAKTLDVPVVLLSQLNRATDSRKDNRPNLSDLRGSGGIEQNADTVAFLFRPSYYEGGDAPEIEDALILIEKNRNGAVGEVEMKFIARQTKWTSGDSTTYIEEQPYFNQIIKAQF